MLLLIFSSVEATILQIGRCDTYINFYCDQILILFHKYLVIAQKKWMDNLPFDIRYMTEIILLRSVLGRLKEYKIVHPMLNGWLHTVSN